MNPSLGYWGALFGLLAVELALVVAVAAAIQRGLKSAGSRRLVWQSTLFAVTLVLLGELAGLRGTLVKLRPKPQVAHVVTARMIDSEPLQLAADAAWPADTLLSTPPPLRSAVWWPGWVWLAGTGLLTLRSVVSRLWLARQRRRATAADEKTMAMVLELGRSLALPAVEVRTWPGLLGPIAFGVLRPTVALPMDFVGRFTPGQRAAMLAHELAHLAARDPLWLALAETVCALAWWHPGVWWARRRLRAASEAHADAASDLVPGGRAALAESLVLFGRELTNPGFARGLGVSGDGLKSELARRITALINSPGQWRAKHSRWRGAIGVAAVLLAAGLLQFSWPGSGGPALGSLLLAQARAAAASNPTTAAADSNLLVPTHLTHFEGFDAYVAENSTNSIKISPGRRHLLDKLDRLVLPNVRFDNEPLEDVVKWLVEETKSRDPDGKGVNFLIVGNPPGPARDPTTGLPVPDSIPNKVKIQLKMELRNVRLRDALEALIRTAEEPLRFSVEDYAVTFGRRVRVSESLHTRRYRVDPKALLQAVEAVAGPSAVIPLSPDRNLVEVQSNGELAIVRLRELFRGAGVDFPSPSHDPNLGGSGFPGIPGQSEKVLFLNDGTGILFVRATLGDLEIIERTLQALNHPSALNVGTQQTSPGYSDPTDAGIPESFLPSDAVTNPGPATPGLEYKVSDPFPMRIEGYSDPASFKPVLSPKSKHTLTAAEAAAIKPENSTRLQDLPLIGRLIRLSGESKPAEDSSSHTTFNLEPANAPTVTLEIKLVEMVEGGSGDLGLDWLFGQARTNNAPVTLEAPTGDLPGAGSTNAANIRVSRQRVEGQAATIGAVQFAALLKQLEERARVDILSAPRVTAASGRQAQIAVQDVRSIVTGVETHDAQGTNSARINYVTEELRTGPVVDIVPTLDDGAWRLDVTGRVTEFLGYDDATGVKVEAKAASGKPVKATVPLPHLRVREVVAAGQAKPGETLVLRGPLVDEKLMMKDKVPVLGDIPLVGGLFRSESHETLHKRLYIFITPVTPK